MILPTKHISTASSLLGLGALLLRHLDRPRTATALWEKVRNLPDIGTFERFSLALDFLYAIGALEFQEDFMRRTRP